VDLIDDRIERIWLTYVYWARPKALSAQSWRGLDEEAEQAALAELPEGQQHAAAAPEISTASDRGAQTISEVLADLVTERVVQCAPTVLLTIATAMAGLVLSFFPWCWGEMRVSLTTRGMETDPQRQDRKPRDRLFVSLASSHFVEDIRIYYVDWCPNLVGIDLIKHICKLKLPFLMGHIADVRRTDDIGHLQQRILRVT
jgi:hypothetical protein